MVVRTYGAGRWWSEHVGLLQLSLWARDRSASELLLQVTTPPLLGIRQIVEAVADCTRDAILVRCGGGLPTRCRRRPEDVPQMGHEGPAGVALGH